MLILALVLGAATWPTLRWVYKLQKRLQRQEARRLMVQGRADFQERPSQCLSLLLLLSWCLPSLVRPSPHAPTSFLRIFFWNRLSPGGLNSHLLVAPPEHAHLHFSPRLAPLLHLQMSLGFLAVTSKIDPNSASFPRDPVLAHGTTCLGDLV